MKVETIKRVKRILGEPVLGIELDENQYEEAFKIAEEDYGFYSLILKKDFKDIKEIWIKKYTLAVCKEILGRIRGKYSGKISIPGDELTLSYKELLQESKDEKDSLILILKEF